jgi:hypothetical protein
MQTRKKNDSVKYLNDHGKWKMEIYPSFEATKKFISELCQKS